MRANPAGILALVVLGSLAWAQPARAAGCTVSSSGGVAFGAYDVFDPAPLDSLGTISYSCTLPVNAPIIQLSQGGASSYAPRRLSSPTDSLDYNLYLDAARTVVWGDGTAGTLTYQAGAPADLQVYDVPVYGRIPALQNVKVGDYDDTIVITIEF